MTDPLHLWEVRASYPVESQAAGQEGKKLRPSYANLRVAVLAPTMERVMKVTRETYPDVSFHSIEKRNHMGKAPVLIDADYAVEVGDDG